MDPFSGRAQGTRIGPTETVAVGSAGAGPAPYRSGADSDERLVGLWMHGKGESTKVAYWGALGAFRGFTGGKPLRTVTLADLQEYADDLAEAFAPATQAKLLAAMKSLFSFGHQIGYLPFDVGRPVKLPSRKDDRAERILSADDVHAMIAGAEGKRNRALLRLLYIGGLRVAEAVDLKTRDLREREGVNGGTGGQVTLFGKGQKTRVVLLPPSPWRELWALALPRPDAPLFRSRKKGPGGEPRSITVRQAERVVKDAARRAGLENASSVSPHWLRHAHASHAMDRGAKVHLVQATLGHASVATTGRYLHARPEESSSLYLG
ncbi:MAG: tyrosine-type recombinase/integrase [Actinomycetota bacterium]|nr:tyrosine-type recombinase/integrase [Actinomycetota bacterium]